MDRFDDKYHPIADVQSSKCVLMCGNEGCEYPEMYEGEEALVYDGYLFCSDECVIDHMKLDVVVVEKESKNG